MKNRRKPRVIACCGGMVIVAGLERMTFEVLRSLKERGAEVHCIVNTWENHRIVALAEKIGASWSTGHYWYGFGRHLLNPLKLVQFLWDVLMASAGLLRDAWRFRPTHVLLPDFVTALRNAPALLLLRCLGVKAILRVGNHPPPGRIYQLLWGKILPPLVNLIVANSYFSERKLLESGAPPEKTLVIRNAVSQRFVAPEIDAEIVSMVRLRRTILCVGQVAPFKGTHLAVEAGLKLLAEGEDLQVVIVGRLPNWPPEFAEYVRTLQAQIEKVGACDRICFVGERQNIAEIMRNSYLLVTPILQEETFGNVALEAKSVGLPVVTFPTGGLLELVGHRQTGYVCQESTAADLMTGIRYFLADPNTWQAAREAGLRAMAEPGNDYDQEVFKSRWWSVFDLSDESSSATLASPHLGKEIRKRAGNVQ